MKIKDLVSVYAMMLKIRLFEERIVEAYPAQEMKTPVHLYIGQEAIAAGVCHHLSKTDLLFTTHRCHGHALAKGVEMLSMMAEFYGKKTGCCSGKGGSMHISDPERGIMATSAIVGGGIAMAVGAGLTLSLKGSRAIAVVFFGDGATDEGIFYESLNFAALKKLPVLFVCENNFYATNSPQSARQPLDNIYRRGEIFGIKGFRCNGNDARQVLKISARLITKMRAGSGPLLLECRTYRWKGHVGPDCDFEKGCRPRYELDTWQKKCPVRFLESYLLKKKALNKEEIDVLRGRLRSEIIEAEKIAKEMPYPEKEEAGSGVYAAENICPGQK
jgi:pyruvate dehydrogenase E1 component alpha subunit